MARIEKTVEVNVPVGTAYRHMTQFEQFPRFMEGVQEVRRLDDRHLHWRSRSDGGEHEWDSEITEQVPDKCIAWRNLNGHANTGRVEFETLGPDKARVTLLMDIRPGGLPDEERHVHSVAAAHAEHNLARFKKMIETETGDAWRKTTADAGASTGTGWNGGGARQEEGQDRAGGEQQEQRGAKAGSRHADWLPRAAGVWEEPFVVMRKVGEEMDHFFERVIGRPLGMPQWAQGGRTWTPQVEVEQRGNEVVICADLPGIRSEDVQIEVRRDRLTIEGERHAQSQQESPRFRRSERMYGHFYREIPLPEGVDPDAAAASMHDGVLEITLPVLPEKQRGRRLDIKPGR